MILWFGCLFGEKLYYVKRDPYSSAFNYKDTGTLYFRRVPDIQRIVFQGMFVAVNPSLVHTVVFSLTLHCGFVCSKLGIGFTGGRVAHFAWIL